MKSPDFDYTQVQTVEQAIALLTEYGDDARILAGGQTLLATLNMRLSEPALLIDITHIAALKTIEVRADKLHIGALVTHTEIERSALIATHAPLLSAAVPHIAHRAIRNAGTWGGSLAFGDSAAEWPCCLVALDGTVVVQGPRGQRRIAARDFFIDLYTTALQPDEIIISADMPIATPGDAYAFDELARRHGDYAVVGLAVAARFDGHVARKVNLSFLGIGSTPVRPHHTEALLAGQQLDTTTLARMVASLQTELDPLPDLTHESATKRHLACVLAKRVLSALNRTHAASLSEVTHG